MVRKDAVEATLRVLGSETESARITKAIKTCERFANAIDGPQKSLMFACLAALEIARGEHDHAHVVTNNIDTEGYDPEGEAGIDEEQALRARILDALARSDEDTVEALVIEARPWEKRWPASGVDG